jgi:hypothetical protein
MKKQLLFIGLLLASFLGHSQTVVFSDNFNDEDISDWTLVDSDGDGYNWFTIQFTDDNGNPVGTPVLASESWKQNPLTPDNWIISPAIDLSAYSGGTATLNWKVASPDPDWDAENYTVYVATSNEIADLEASTVTFNESTLDGVNDYINLAPRSLDISDFAGSSAVYVAFRHHNVSDQYLLLVDDVEVVANAASSVDESSIPNFAYSISNSVLHIKSAEKFNGISIFDITGKTILSKTLNSSNENIPLIVSEGIYIAKVTTDSQAIKTFKFIIR